MALWKRLILISASFGVGVVVAIAAIWGAVNWHEGHQAWNTNALKASFGTLGLNTEPSKDSYDAEFDYDIQNNTSKNYPFNPSAFTVMAYLSDGKVLSKEAGNYQTSDITIEGPRFIPSHSKARIILRTTYQYPTEFTAADKNNIEKVGKTIDARLKEFSGFALFDQENHYRIELPDGWKTSPDASDKTASSNIPCPEKDTVGLFTKEPCKPRASKDAPPCPANDPLGLKTSQACAPLPSKVKE